VQASDRISSILAIIVRTETASASDFISTRVMIRLTDGARADTVLTQDLVSKTIFLFLYDTVTATEQISKTPNYRLRDEIIADDFKQALVIRVRSIFETVDVDDVASTVSIFNRFTDDTLLTGDELSKLAHYRLHNEVTVFDDVIRLFVKLVVEDPLLIDDGITVVTQFNRFTNDTAYTQDEISTFVQYRLRDDIIVSDFIAALHVQVIVEDPVIIGDEIKAALVLRPRDTASVSDSIFKDVFVRLTDGTRAESAISADTISKLVLIFLQEDVTVFDDLKIVPIIRLEDNTSVSDSILKDISVRLVDGTRAESAISADTISTFVSIFLQDDVTTQDELRLTLMAKIEDSTLLTDVIAKDVSVKLQDNTIADDFIAALHVQVIVEDPVIISDELKAVVFFFRFSETAATVSDAISTKVFVRLVDDTRADSTLTADAISITPSLEISDTALTDDFITTSVTYRKLLFNEVTTFDEPPTKVVSIRLTDDTRADSTLTADAISITPSLEIKPDTAVVSDAIIRKFIKILETESASVSDSISTKVFVRLVDDTRADSIITDDRIGILSTVFISDSASIRDNMQRLFVKILVPDTVSVSDSISTQVSARLVDSTRAEAVTNNDLLELRGFIDIETRDELGNLIPGAQYIIIPNPYTGTGFLPAVDNGTNDYDMSLDGRIIVQLVPLDLYMVNQTLLPNGYVPIYNFTHVTVHETDINATAVFRVTQNTTNLSQLGVMDSDTVDIDSPPGFDGLLDSVDIFKVRGTQQKITEVDEMPVPIFVGANNLTQIDNAVDSQYTLLYKNIATLTPNATPEDIIDAFALAPFDSGNSPDTTFVGILTATPASSSGQYIATQPLDKFNCGQRYIFDLDETLVPSYGGLSKVDFTLSDTGVCPDGIDYVTYEVAPKVTSGAPALANEDILLYLNVQFPGQSGDGVNFDSSVNIESYTMTLVSRLPETGNVNDLTVYVFDGGKWTTSGVDVISRVSGGSKAVLEVEVSHTSKFIVGGKKIPEPPPGHVSGFGPTGVDTNGLEGPSKEPAKPPAANIHRVSYDVCNENISRILVAHDSSKTPRIQILTGKSGVIEATLADIHPYNGNSNQQLYLFEAPLSPAETVFTIYAVDYRSNVEKVTIEIEGCEGTILFVDEEILLPQIFDFKYSIPNGTDIRPKTAGHHYIDESTQLEVSAIINSPLVPLKRAEIRVLPVVSDTDNANYTNIPMDISSLILEDIDSIYTVSGIIPDDIVESPAIQVWIRVVTQEGLVQESERYIVGIRPDGYNGTSVVEMDTQIIKAQGTILRPTAYVTNQYETPVYGTMSLLVDGKSVYSKPALLIPGQNVIGLEWSIPKSITAVSYEISAKLEVYDTQYITSVVTIDTYVRTQSMGLSEISEIVPAVNSHGNTIARPALIYSSNQGEGRFHVVSPDGTCVIGSSSDCLITDSTSGKRGALDSIVIDSQIYRVRYSGPDSPLERFSITSFDGVAGEWKVLLEKSGKFVAFASDDSEILVKVKYRAETSPLVTVRSASSVVIAVSFERDSDEIEDFYQDEPNVIQVELVDGVGTSDVS
jgi:hypothetical protein